MQQKLIKQFIWGYQEHFRVHMQVLAKGVLETLGISLEPKVFLVGIRAPDTAGPNPICIEPENGEWSDDLFAGLMSAVEAEMPNNPLQNMFYDHRPTMEKKPANIRKTTIIEQLQVALRGFESENGVKIFVGMPEQVGDYYVATILQIPEYVYEQFPRLQHAAENGHKSNQSLIDTALMLILEAANAELNLREPGASFSQYMRNSREIVQLAAERFMKVPGSIIGDSKWHAELFGVINALAALKYESEDGIGKLLLIDPACPQIDYVMRFREPVPLREARWARKILQASSMDLALISSCTAIYGIGTLNPSFDDDNEKAFWIDFTDHYQWSLRNGQCVHLRSVYGVAKLPVPWISEGRFAENLERVFSNSTVNPAAVWKVYQQLLSQERGAMVIVAEDAASEVVRMAQQGMQIAPQPTTSRLIEAASRIDGSIIIDPTGLCHGFGFILDGDVNIDCLPSRGSRYNSAARYVSSSTNKRLAIVISQDRTVDVLPLLRPKISLATIERAILSLENSTQGEHHQFQNYLAHHRFYLHAQQCERINAALARISSIPKDVGEISWVVAPFEPDPEMNATYYT